MLWAGACWDVVSSERHLGWENRCYQCHLCMCVMRALHGMFNG